MPKVSRESATQGGDYGPVVDRSDEVEGYSELHDVPRGHRRDPADEGASGRPLPVPALGLRHHRPVRSASPTARRVFEAGDAFYTPPGHVPVKHEPGTEIVHVQPRRGAPQDRGRDDEEHAGDAGRLTPRLGAGTRAGNSSSGRSPCRIAKRPARGAGRGVDLRVDVLGVVGDRLRGDHEPRGDLLVREPSREQPEHLDLARRQPRRALAAPRDAVAGGAEHRLDGVGVVAPRPHSARSSAGASSAERSGRWGRGSRIAW